jgi:hypothetical protein
MADEAPVRTLEEFQAIAEEHGGILGFCRTGDFWDGYIVHVEILRDRPPYRSSCRSTSEERSTWFRKSVSARSSKRLGPSVRSWRLVRSARG